MLDVLNNVPYLPASRCNFSSPTTDLHPDIPAVPARSALPEDVLPETPADVPAASVSRPDPPSPGPLGSDHDEDTVELEGHGPLRSAEDWKADPWAAMVATTRAMITTETESGNFLRACLGPLVRPMSRDPTEMTIDQLGLARIVAALRVRRRVEGNTDLVKVDARILARPDKGMIVAGIPAEADAMIADLLHAVRSPPRGAVRGEMSAADVMAPPMTVAIATETGAGMTDVTNRIPLRLADPRLATAVEMVMRIAVGMEETEVTAVDVGEMTRPETGKNPVQGGRQVPQSSSALEGPGWRTCRRKKATAPVLFSPMRRCCG